MVTVQLVEKSVKRSVGTDIVVSLRLQYKIVDRRWRRNRINLPINPSQEDEPCVSTSLPVCIAIVAKAEAELSTTVERLPARAVPPPEVLDKSMVYANLYTGKQIVSLESMRRIQPSMLSRILITKLPGAYGQEAVKW